MQVNEQKEERGHYVYLGLGSNIGDRKGFMQRALTLLQERVGVLVACSSFVETKPWGFESEHNFLNAAAALRTTLSPQEVLYVTQQIERELGRTTKGRKTSITGIEGYADCTTEGYTDRTMDIDILFYDNLRIDKTFDDINGQEQHLVIPHPLMLERDFVMTPLREICFPFPTF